MASSRRDNPGRPGLFWPLGALLLVTLLASGAVLWFLIAVVSNEKLAARERMAIAYRGYAEAGKAAITLSWREFSDEGLGVDLSPPERFAKAAMLPGVKGAVVYEGMFVEYPGLIASEEAERRSPRWVTADAAEFQRMDLMAATREYRAIATDAMSEGNRAEAELAIRAEIRCLSKLGELDAARTVFLEGFSEPSAVAASSALALFDALEKFEHAGAENLGKRLAAWAGDYEAVWMEAPQRRLIMKAVEGRDFAYFPTMQAEELAARQLIEDRGPTLPTVGLADSGLQGTSVWWDGASKCRVLFDQEGLQQRLGHVFASVEIPADARLVARSPRQASAKTMLVSTAAGELMPGWRIDVEVKESALADVGQRRIATYTAGGIGVIVALCGLSLTVGIGLRRQLNRAQIKHDLAATISHELKTPLSSMRLLVDLLLEGEGGDEKRSREYLAMIAAENARLSHLVENFLAYARIEQGASATATQIAQPGDIVRAAREAVERRYGEGRIEVEVEADLPAVKTDAGALGTALLNLADNACKYSPEDEPVNLRCSQRDRGELCFEVADRGEGFSDAGLARAFRSFERLDESAEAPGGCGLGLYIVKRLVERLGGQLEVDSELGEGSSFRILIPAGAGGQGG